MNSKWIMDEENYPNIFTVALIREDEKFENVFEVSARMNQIDRILAFVDHLEKEDDYMVGFNNLNWDYPILHKILAIRHNLPKCGEECARLFYTFAEEQIASMKGEFANTVKTDDRIVKQIDLFKLNHFDNKAKMTSLKMLEFNMRENNIEDLPFPVGKDLTFEEMDVLKKYNQHDVRMTLAFYRHCKAQIEFREKLTQQFGKDFMNHSDSKIGGDFFQIKLQEAGIPIYKQVGRQRKLNQTIRPHIKLRECLFDYYDFQRPEFVAIKNWFSKQIIKETKGVFTDIEEHKLYDVAQFAEMIIKKKKCPNGEPSRSEYDEFKREHPCGWVEKIQLKAKKKGEFQHSYYYKWRIAETLNVVIDGLRYDFGVGGIHASVQNSVVCNDEDYELIDADVSSMYPNISISNNVYPQHLTSKFCELYSDLYEQRKSYDKKSAENAMLKLALNATYGNSNNEYSVFFDSQYTMKITINGQLSLCLLAEKLMKIDGLIMLACNTDGLTVKLPRNKRDEYNEICKAWQKQVKLDLEFVEYEKMWVRDINNYTALYTDGKIKQKGAYEYKDLGWHKNHSSLVIPMAAEAAMLRGEDVREFIMNHTEKFDFMLRTKVPRSSRLVLVNQDGTESALQNICRYYPCKSGGKLIKIMPPLEEGGEERRLGIDTMWDVKPCNSMDDYVGDIDYEYYVTEAEKLVIK